MFVIPSLTALLAFVASVTSTKLQEPIDNDQELQFYTLNSSGVISIDSNPEDVFSATAWSLIYTYPLAVFASWSGGVLAKNYTVNQIFHQRALATPTNGGVIKPNVDTLYSRVVLDLSQQDVVLTVPNISAGRYWVYPVYDPFGNNQAEIGAVNGNQAGKYLIRRAEDAFVAPGYSNDSRTFDSSRFVGAVNVPGSYATMLIRLELLHNTTEDLNAVHGYQDASQLTQLTRSNSSLQQINTNPAPQLTSLALNGSLLGIESPAEQLEFAARIIPYSQPELASERYRVASILARAGLFNGHYHAPRDLNLTEAATIANNSITADTEDPAHVRNFANDWKLSIPAYQGNFGKNYASAAYVAIAGYQQQTIRQTLYPGFRSVGFTSVFTLQPNHSLLLTFSGKPQLTAPGFWSLSVYGSDQNLIPNSLERYEVGDRTYSLTYQDGSGDVYGPQANSSHDGPFQILVQPANTPPPSNWTSNWLPAETNFSWLLRWYVPSPAMTDGSYSYPSVQNITAIV